MTDHFERIKEAIKSERQGRERFRYVSQALSALVPRVSYTTPDVPPAPFARQSCVGNVHFVWIGKPLGETDEHYRVRFDGITIGILTIDPTAREGKFHVICDGDVVALRLAGPTLDHRRGKAFWMVAGAIERDLLHTERKPQ